MIHDLLYRLRPKLAIQGLGGFLSKFQHAKQAFGGYDWCALLQKEN